MDSVKRAAAHLGELDDLFRGSKDPYRAHEEAKGLLGRLARDVSFFQAVIHQQLLDTVTYNHERKAPAIEFVLESNPYYTLVANCWLPRDDRDTELSNQSVHHHGTLLLSTVALLGPGYETWNFTKPEAISGKELQYNMAVTYAGRHTIGNMVFVDAFIPHIVYYPERLSVTLCLWSYRTPVTWKTKMMKAHLLQRYKAPMKVACQRLGLAGLLGLNVISLMDYYPAGGAFRGLLNRVTFPMGTNKNFLQNFFHVVQETGNAEMAELVDFTLRRHRDEIPNAELIEEYCSHLRHRVPIEPKFEDSHNYLPYATLRLQEVKAAAAGIVS